MLGQPIHVLNATWLNSERYVCKYIYIYTYIYIYIYVYTYICVCVYMCMYVLAASMNHGIPGGYQSGFQIGHGKSVSRPTPQHKTWRDSERRDTCQKGYRSMYMCTFAPNPPPYWQYIRRKGLQPSHACLARAGVEQRSFKRPRRCTRREVK